MRRRSYAVAAAGALLLAVAPAQARAAAVTPVACSTLALTTAISTAAAGDTLVLTSYCVYTLADLDGQQTISVPLTIQGNNATIRRDPAASTQFRIFEITNVAVAMDTLTIMNGNSTASGGGVALGTDGGSLTATDVNFQGNSANVGGAIDAEDGTALSLTGGTVNDNRATLESGGIQATGETSVNLSSVTVSGNRSEAYAGGVTLDTDLPSTITDSTIRGNTAKEAAGGVYVSGSATLNIIGTAIMDNRVTNSVESGGGILINPDSGSVVTAITNSTISGNRVTGYTTADNINSKAGGIYLEGGQLVLDNTRVASNQIIGPNGKGAGIAVGAAGLPSTLTLQNATTVTGNLASGRYSQGGGIYVNQFTPGASVSVTGSHIDGNKVTGTGSVSGGIYNIGGTFSFATSSVNDNIAPIAPAPGGVYTSVPITTVDGATTFTGNTPTNCLLSPAAVTNCVN